MESWNVQFQVSAFILGSTLCIPSLVASMMESKYLLIKKEDENRRQEQISSLISGLINGIDIVFTKYWNTGFDFSKIGWYWFIIPFTAFSNMALSDHPRVKECLFTAEKIASYGLKIYSVLIFPTITIESHWTNFENTQLFFSAGMALMSLVDVFQFKDHLLKFFHTERQFDPSMHQGFI